MKLQAIADGAVLATAGRRLLRTRDGGSFQPLGRLPLPADRPDRWRHRLLSTRRLAPVTDRLVGTVTTVNVWPLGGESLLGTIGPQIAVSADGGRTWDRTGRLPDSSGPMGVLPPAVDHRDGVTVLGEYPLDSAATPRVLRSVDRGRSWEPVVRLPDVRHVHGVTTDPYTGDRWLTTGDTDAESHIGRLVDGTFEPVGGGSQDWRAVELAFTPSAVLWGMDCAFAEGNRIYRLPRARFDDPDPTPEAVATLPGSVYYAADWTHEGERWVAFSTAMEAGRDRTGPAGQTNDDARGIVVIASSATGFEDWTELCSFRRRRCLGDRIPLGLPRANGYLFLEAAADVGLLVNPYNTASAAGTIRRHPAERLAHTSG